MGSTYKFAAAQGEPWESTDPNWHQRMMVRHYKLQPEGGSHSWRQRGFSLLHGGLERGRTVVGINAFSLCLPAPCYAFSDRDRVFSFVGLLCSTFIIHFSTSSPGPRSVFPYPSVKSIHYVDDIILPSECFYRLSTAAKGHTVSWGEQRWGLNPLHKMQGHVHRQSSWESNSTAKHM